jgi:FkbM family methyltransferase
LPRENGVFLDIGANAGIFSLYAVSLMETGLVIAIEPIPLLFERLSENLVSLNPSSEGRIRAHLANCAAGAEPGALELFVPEQLGQASLHPLPSAQQYKVPVRPLLDIVQESGAARIDVMKIDVEGFEDSVLGPFFGTAPEALWPHAIILEHCHQQRWGRDIRADLIARGYRVARTDRTNTMLRREQR